MDSKTGAAGIPADDLNRTIGVLVRREVEARFLAPLVEALGAAFGREPVLQVIRETIRSVARRQGAELALAAGGNSLSHFRDQLIHWTRGDALALEMIEDGREALAFNVTRCRYAEMYRQLELPPELGAILSCDRDFALIEGFNPRIRLTRRRTLMAGEACCDFRYELRP